MSLLESRDYYKPFSYPWAYEAYKKMQAMHWLPHEAPMADDIKDWGSKLKAAEQTFLIQLFRFFTQADIDIAKGYRSKYMPRFDHPEVQMMFASFVAAEANHIDAYSTLMETLGISEGEYKAFHNYKAMREKHEYLFERESGKSIADLIVDIAVFSAFGEGMQLFSSFALLMNFQRRGLMKGMTTIVEWSIRDETHHVESMIRLFHELVKEHPRAWNDETKKRVYDAVRAMVKLEDAFIDQAFGVLSKDGAYDEIAGVSPSDTKGYIRYIADRRLIQLGMKPNWKQKSNPFEWLDEIMNLPTHTNFFEQRATEYSKEELGGWDEAFAAFDLGVFSTDEMRSYQVWGKPGCPHCERAEALLDRRGIAYDYEVLEAKADRDAKLAEVKADYGVAWTTFPVILARTSDHVPIRFVGGADALHKELAE